MKLLSASIACIHVLLPLAGFAASSGVAVKPAGQDLNPGLLVTEYPRHAEQADNSKQFYLPLDRLGSPIGAPHVAETLMPWKWTTGRNAVARGYLEIQAEGDYAFTTDSFYDRNLLMLGDEIVCGFGDGTDRVATVHLKKGRVSIVSYGVAESRGSEAGIRIRWRPPGQLELSPIPPERLSHPVTKPGAKTFGIEAGHAGYLITAADDFVVEAYQNGVKIGDAKRKILEEHHGATTERFEIDVHPGDWLVFHVVNNRMRWGGQRYFAAAGLMGMNQFRFVSDPGSPDWSSCDNPEEAGQFIRQRDFGISQRARPIAKIWTEGDRYMRKHAGDAFSGEPLWGAAASTWIKYVAPAGARRQDEMATKSGGLFDSLGATLETGGDGSFHSAIPAIVSPRRWPVQILSATYGTGGKNADVTAAVKQWVEVRKAQFSVSPPDLGADPNPYWNKSLHIVYMKDGVRREQHRNENEFVLPQSFYGPQDAAELRAWLLATRWSGAPGELQFHADRSLTRTGLNSSPHWETLAANKLRITWDSDRKTEYTFDYTWESFRADDDASSTFHLMK